MDQARATRARRFILLFCGLLPFAVFVACGGTAGSERSVAGTIGAAFPTISGGLGPKPAGALSPACATATAIATASPSPAPAGTPVATPTAAC